MKKLLLVLLIFIIAEKNYGQENPTQKNENVNRDVKDGSTNTYEIIYDFRTGEYVKNNLRIKVNTPTVFKIININRLAYDIKISSKDTLLAETFMSDELGDESIEALSKNKERVFISTSNGVITNPLQLDISTLDKTEDFINKNDQDNSNLFDDFKKVYNINKLEEEKLKLQKELDKLNTKVAYLLNIKSILTENASKISSFQDNLNKITSQLNNINIANKEEKEIEENRLNNEKSTLAQKISELQKQNDEIKNNAKDLDTILKDDTDLLSEKEEKIKDKEVEILNASKNLKEIVKKYNNDNLALQEAFYKLNTSYQKILKLLDNYSKIKTVADYPYLNKEKYKDEYKNAIRKEIDLTLLERDVAINFKDHYTQVSIKYSNLKYNPYLAEYLNYGGQTKLFAQGNYIKELADKIYTDVANIKIEMLFQKMVHLKELLENDNTFNYVSAPIQPTQDAAIFEVKITKKEGNHSDVTDEKSFNHSEFTYGGTRIDFSVGLAASRFWNTNVYEFGVQKDLETNEEYTVLSKKENHLTVPSMVGLITMSYRKTGYMAYGCSAGLGIDVVNGRIQLSNFFIGPTILFGKYDRLFLTGGLSFRNVGQLKSGYNTQERLNSGTDDINNFITEKYKIGGFMSLTYNLTKGVRANYKRLNK